MPVKRRLYFINEEVEDKLREYIWTACTSVEIRDSIMMHATELIRQIIRKQNLHTIYPGQEETSFSDLVQTAWVQIEKTLYKFRANPHCRLCYSYERPMDSILYESAQAEYGILTYDELFAYLKYGRDVIPSGAGSLNLKVGKKKLKQPKDATCPHCQGTLEPGPSVKPEQYIYGGSLSVLFRGQSKVFNMWSQVARTVILAFIKKEGRDKKNSGSYREHLTQKFDPSNDRLLRFFTELKDICKYNNEFSMCADALRAISLSDERPHDGLIGKLVTETGLSRSQVSQFIKMLRLRSNEFSDSPINFGRDQLQDRRRYTQGAANDDD